MSTMSLVSWNVNGLRAVWKKGFLNWVAASDADVIALQETKIQEHQLTEDMRELDGYQSWWSFAEKKGYSGVALYSRNEPEEVSYDLAVKKFDCEGRVIRAHFPSFTFYNVYFPNGQMSDERLQYKLDFYDTFLKDIESWRKRGKHIIVCGDLNTAHKEKDIARPKQNEKTSGFLPVERAWMDKLVETGYIDTFRMFSDDPGQYTWWTYRAGARQRNVGWRLDYFFVSEEASSRVQSAQIHSEVMGSDHCPVSIDLAV